MYEYTGSALLWPDPHFSARPDTIAMYYAQLLGLCEMPAKNCLDLRLCIRSDGTYHLVTHANSVVETWRKVILNGFETITVRLEGSERDAI